LAERILITSKNTVGVDAIAIHNHIGGVVVVSVFGAPGEVWVLSQL
jgi:hypothetical protein